MVEIKRKDKAMLVRKEEKMPKISVIVPVYNTEKYVEKCLDSISNQKLKDLELIIVNDGSEDNSEAIIKQWIEKNNEKIEIKYLKKENGGLSDSRNYAIPYVTGKYISFIDSDDYIDENLYNNLEKYMDDDIDLIKFKMQKVDEMGKTLEKLEGPVFEKCTGEEAYKKLCVEEKFLDPACIYLYKTEFFKENNFQYENGTFHEDFGLTSLIILKAKSFVSTNEYGYYYLQSNNSITRNSEYKKEVKKAKDLLKHYDNMLQKLRDYNVTEESKNLIKRYYTNVVILKTNDLKGKDLENYIFAIKKRKLYKNIKPYNLKQLLKRIILHMSIKLYLKIK